jgi:hypothetical protein
MDIAGPRVRRRGFFVHVETPELDQVEQESPEGVAARLRVARPRTERHSIASIASRKPTHAVRTTNLESRQADIRLESATGSHRQARMSR